MRVGGSSGRVYSEFLQHITAFPATIYHPAHKAEGPCLSVGDTVLVAVGRSVGKPLCRVIVAVFLLRGTDHTACGSTRIS